ncbi:MAG: murein L,D-transpeptidase [Chitinophagales bacterium]
MSPKIKRFILISLVGASFLSCKKNRQQPEEMMSADSVVVIQKVFEPFTVDSIAINGFIKDHPMFSFHADEIHAFYKNRGGKSAWFNEYGIVEQGGLFMNLLENFDEEGIKDSVIYYSDLQKKYLIVSDPAYNYTGSIEKTRSLELMLTSEFFIYAQKVWFGLSEKTTNDLDWYIKRKTVPSVSILDSILAGGKNAFTIFKPLYPQYDLLKNKLKAYRSIDTNISWNMLVLPEGKKFIKAGDNASVVAELKSRLFILGDLSENDSTNLFDEQLTEAIKKFQVRHGLKPDGSAGEKFFEQINVSIPERIRQIEINMERCRWIPDEPQGNYIIVNIPAYKMFIYADDTLDWTINVVVGKASTGTTIFNDELEYIVFSPYWVPPPSILNNEILPALKKNSNYLQKENMEAFDASGNVIDVSNVDWNKYTKMPYRIRQKPGGSNSLGWVKFLFPNEHNIYFHDTPSRNLFSESQRNFSHGCIRLEEPKKFAEYLLRNDSTFTQQKIDSLYYLGKETYVKLKEKIPVYLVYFTAWVDENGNINFRKDIYGHDAKLEKTLFVD